jgi:hypothetical protein
MMTFRFAKCAVAIGAIGLAGVLQSSAQAADTTATATATVATAIGIAKTVDMSFGTIGATAIAGTVVLGTDGSRTCTDVDCLSGSPGAAASFDVTGEGANTYSITLPANGVVTLTGPGPAMAADNFTSLPAATGTLTAGAETLLVGAELFVAIAATQTPGAYTSAAFTVTVNYN